MDLRYVDLNSGVVSHVERHDVSILEVAKMAAWLGAALLTDEPMALPGSVLSGYDGFVQVLADMLTLTVSANSAANGLSNRCGLATLTVAKTEAVSGPLWAYFAKEHSAVVERPAAPWCALSRWESPGRPMSSLHRDHPQLEQWLESACRTIGWMWTHQQWLLRDTAEALKNADRRREYMW